ncbi:MAG: GHMP kinase [Pirellulaceae bacterium]|nr:GHMP kinase [Pirellulaceae bacterium]
MRLIRKRAYARAGLIGNPSDGYFGKTIALTIPQFRAEVSLYEWDQLELVWSENDQTRFRSIDELVSDVRLHGYYGGIRLVRATIKKFADYCRGRGIRLHDDNFSVRYESNIPRLVGLAGSSAIIVATLRCLMEFYDVAIPIEVQPSLALAVETQELGISAGLQDRVAQVHEGVVYMDFARDRMHEVNGLACGVYEPLDPALLPPLYLAYCAEVSNPTESVHNNLRARFEQGEPAVIDVMEQLAQLTVEAREALLAGRTELLGPMMDRNFDLRRSICRLPAGQVDMVLAARRVGATAKFAGSGGAIVGTYADARMLEELTRDLEAIGCRVIIPQTPNTSK